MFKVSAQCVYQAGSLMDFIPFFLGTDWNKEVTLIGEGKKPASWTSLADVAGTHVPCVRIKIIKTFQAIWPTC